MSTTRGGAARLDDLGGKGGGGDDELDGEWQWPKTSLGKKISSLELSLRCLICSNYLNNPHSLSCGHSYCSECIRKHLDKSYNPTPSSGYCPTCREIANPSQLRVSKDLINVISLYQELRNELLVFLTTATTPNLTKQSQSYDETNTDHDHHINNPNIRSNSKKTHEITRLPAKLFHIETKEKVRKALEKLTENCSTKIRLDGDKETLVKRYTEFVHINNAQLSAKNPLSLSEIVHEVHRRERALEFHNSMSKKSNLIVEKLKAGQVVLISRVLLNFFLLGNERSQSWFLRANQGNSSISEVILKVYRELVNQN